VNLYFDSNIYDLIVKRNEVQDVRRWLRATGHQVYASLEGDVTEALRAPESMRVPLVTAITRIAKPVHPPYDYRHFREIAAEIARQRPRWLRRPIDRKAIDVYLRRRRAEWNVIKEDPAYAPSNLGQQGVRVAAAIGVDTGRQRTSRRLGRSPEWIRHSASDVQQCIDSLSQKERHWRYVASEEVPASLNAEIRKQGHLEWLRVLSWPQPTVEWHRFWMCDVEADRVPISRIIGLVELFQRQRKVTSGNSIDRICHAPHLVGFDRLITGDADFLKILQQVTAEFAPGVLAVPVAVGMANTSAVAAIQHAVNSAL
jgi:hypothetical protein